MKSPTDKDTADTAEATSLLATPVELQKPDPADQAPKPPERPEPSIPASLARKMVEDAEHKVRLEAELKAKDAEIAAANAETAKVKAQAAAAGAAVKTADEILPAGKPRNEKKAKDEESDSGTKLKQLLFGLLVGGLILLVLLYAGKKILSGDSSNKAEVEVVTEKQKEEEAEKARLKAAADAAKEQIAAANAAKEAAELKVAEAAKAHAEQIAKLADEAKAKIEEAARAQASRPSAPSGPSRGAPGSSSNPDEVVFSSEGYNRTGNHSLKGKDKLAAALVEEDRWHRGAEGWTFPLVLNSHGNPGPIKGATPPAHLAPPPQYEWQARELTLTTSEGTYTTRGAWAFREKQ